MSNHHQSNHLFVVMMIFILTLAAPSSSLSARYPAIQDSVASAELDAAWYTIRFQDGVVLDTALYEHFLANMNTMRAAADTLESIHIYPAESLYRLDVYWDSEVMPLEWPEGLLTGDKQLDSLNEVFKLIDVYLLDSRDSTQFVLTFDTVFRPVRAADVYSQFLDGFAAPT